MIDDLFKKIAKLSDDDLREELNKYPNTESLRIALKGYMSAYETRTKNKEILIEKVLERRRKGSFISEIGSRK